MSTVDVETLKRREREMAEALRRYFDARDAGNERPARQEEKYLREMVGRRVRPEARDG